MYLTLFKEGLIGFITFASISYIAQIFSNFTNLYKIGAFLWSVPLTYFFIIYIINKNNNMKHLIHFNKHSLLGIICTLTLMSLAEIMFGYNIDTQTILNTILFSTIVILFIYFYYQIYNLI
jgi:hypothetical protein